MEEEELREKKEAARPALEFAAAVREENQNRRQSRRQLQVSSPSQGEESSSRGQSSRVDDLASAAQGLPPGWAARRSKNFMKVWVLSPYFPICPKNSTSLSQNPGWGRGESTTIELTGPKARANGNDRGAEKVSTYF